MEVLTDPVPVNDYPHFLSEAVAVPQGFQGKIARVLLLKRLREVNALLGFTRVEAPDDSGGGGAGPIQAPLSRVKPDWVPANQVHGEGIFIQFDEQSIAVWEQGPMFRPPMRGYVVGTKVGGTPAVSVLRKMAIQALVT